MHKCGRFVLIIFIIVFNCKILYAKEYIIPNVLSVNIPDEWITVTYDTEPKLLSEVYKLFDEIAKNSTSIQDKNFLSNFMIDNNYLLKSISIPFSDMILIQKLPENFNEFYKEAINKFDLYKKDMDNEILSSNNELKKYNINIVKYEPCRIVTIDGVCGIAFAIITDNDKKKNLAINYILPLEKMAIQIQFISNNIDNIAKLNMIKNSLKFLNFEKSKYSISKEYNDILDNLQDIKK